MDLLCRRGEDLVFYFHSLGNHSLVSLLYEISTADSDERNGCRPAVVALSGFALGRLRLAVIIAGFLGGLGSVHSVLAEKGTFVNNFAAGLGYTGILVALFLVTRQRALRCLPWHSAICNSKPLMFRRGTSGPENLR